MYKQKKVIISTSDYIHLFGLLTLNNTNNILSRFLKKFKKYNKTSHEQSLTLTISEFAEIKKICESHGVQKGFAYRFGVKINMLMNTTIADYEWQIKKMKIKEIYDNAIKKSYDNVVIKK